MAHCLVVDDDPDLADLIAEILSVDGHKITVVNSGAAGLDQCRSGAPDLLVLDFEMPLMNGRETAAAVRKISPIPILMLTALDDHDERVLALTTDVDDYMIKPFHAPELRARAQALLRRPLITPAASIDCSVDIWKRSATVRGQTISLTEVECDLLKALLDAFPEAVSKQDLVTAAWGGKDAATSHALDVHLHRLRKKLSDTGVLIANTRGKGFRVLEA